MKDFFMFFPIDDPVLQGLNSYYINVKKLIEHFQGEIETGVIYFKGPVTEGAVFFESEYFLEAFFKKNNTIHNGDKALKGIIENCSTNNYEIYIYYLDPKNVFLWSEILKTVKSCEKTSLSFKELILEINNFCAEKHTGYFSVTTLKESLKVFFVYGEFIGYFFKNQVFYSTTLKDKEKTIKGLGSLLSKPKAKLEIFKKIKTKEVSVNKQPDKKIPDDRIILIMGELIGLFEGFVIEKKKIKTEFDPFLKKTCMKFLDKYDFLDPFAAEFIYENGKIEFSGRADNKKFVQSIFDCMTFAGQELNINKELVEICKKWYNDHQTEIEALNLVFPFK